MAEPVREQNALTYLYDFNGTEIEKDGIIYLFYTARHQYYRGEPVQMTLVKVNNLNRDVIFTYRNTQYYDFTVKQNQTSIWRWSNGKFFLQVIQQKLLSPGEMQTIQEIWQIPEDIPAAFYTLEVEDKALNGIKLQLGIEVR